MFSKGPAAPEFQSGSREDRRSWSEDLSVLVGAEGSSRFDRHTGAKPFRHLKTKGIIL